MGEGGSPRAFPWSQGSPPHLQGHCGTGGREEAAVVGRSAHRALLRSGPLPCVPRPDEYQTLPPGLAALQGLEPDYAELAERFAGSSVRVAKFQADVEREFAAEAFGLKTFPTIVLLPKSQPGQLIRYPTERRDADTLAMWVKTLTGTQA